MPNTPKILIVDDDPELRDALTEQLAVHLEDSRQKSWPAHQVVNRISSTPCPLACAESGWGS
jgi:CheY-like chemotaxis protein